MLKLRSNPDSHSTASRCGCGHRSLCDVNASPCRSCSCPNSVLAPRQNSASIPFCDTSVVLSFGESRKEHRAIIPHCWCNSTLIVPENDKCCCTHDTPREFAFCIPSSLADTSSTSITYSTRRCARKWSLRKGSEVRRVIDNRCYSRSIDRQLEEGNRQHFIPRTLGGWAGSIHIDHLRSELKDFAGCSLLISSLCVVCVLWL